MTRGPHRLWASLATAVLALGCKGPAPSQTPYPPCVTSETVELGTLRVEVESDVGTVRGVDLDGLDTDLATVRSSDLGCKQQDWPDPDGASVDNNFAVLEATIEAAFETDPRDLFPGNALTLEVEGRGDGVCAGVSVALGDGPWRDAEWNGSTLRAYDLGDVPLHFALLGDSAEVTLHDAAVRMTLTEEGRVATVVLSGGLDIDALVSAVASEPSVGLDDELIRTALDGVADLEPNADGICTRISIGLEASPA